MEHRKSSLLISSSDRKLWRTLTDCFTGFNLEFAQTVEEAEMKLLDGRMDVLVYDVGANSMFTPEALEVIRKIRPHLPVIALTEAIDQKLEQKLVELGVFYLLVKPVSLEPLKTLVASALKKFQEPHPD